MLSEPFLDYRANIRDTANKLNSKRFTVILHILYSIIQTERNNPKCDISGFCRVVC
jgi:hypothetical protein